MKFCDEKIQKHLLAGGKIKRRLNSADLIIHFSEFGYIYDNDEDYYDLNKSDLTTDDWEIVEPEYNWNRIIKDKVLCMFYNNIEDMEDSYVGYLTKKTTCGFYRNNGFCPWMHCKPFNPADFNIAKNIKEYEK